MIRSWSVASVLAVLSMSAACGVGCAAGSAESSGGTPAADTGSLAETSGELDAVVDTTVDETSAETGEDAVAESSADSSPEDSGAVDSGVDSGPEAEPDTLVDTAVEEVAVDTGPPDAAPDACGAASCSIDSDGDGVPDSIEGRCSATPRDSDGDGTPDYLDLDSDADGIPDKLEWAAGGCNPAAPLNDADGDGVPNYLDSDSDGNGLPDKDEACPPLGMPGRPVGCSVTSPSDFDGDGIADFLDPDNDHDSSSPSKFVGLEDRFELTNSSGVYVGLVDSDGDGIPDLYDRDSDNDFILDLDEGLNDSDGDGQPNFRDTDSDGDGVPDRCEARAKTSASTADYALPLLDTDKDGKPDYVDVDSDGDLITDGKEDLNGNCVADSTETDRLKGDTDGDGVSDLIEVALLGTAGATSASTTPASAGKFYFLEPYSTDGSALPSPSSSTLALSTDLQKGDLGIVVDSTYSMQPEFDNLKTNLGTIIDTLKTSLPDLGVGIAGADDFPTSQYFSTTNTFGSCDNSVYAGGLPATDNPYYLLTPVTTVRATATSAVTSLRMANGSDLPEDQVVALHYSLTGNGFSWPALNGCVAGSRATVAETSTNFGAMQFRKGALPILMNLSDAEFHNGISKPGRIPGPATSVCLYDPGGAGCTTYTGYPTVSNYSFTAPNISDLATALKTRGARFIGAAADDARAAFTGGVTYRSGPSAGVAGTSAARNANWAFGAFGDMEYLVDQTASYVDPSDFTHTAACPVGQCCTGFNGAGITPDAPGGKCKLVFNVNHNGTGLSTQVVDSVLALLNAIRFDAYVQATPDVGAVDSVNAFMTAIQPSSSAGVDPVTSKACLAAPGTADKYNTPKALPGAGDIAETATGINPGSLYCFNVVPKKNTTVPATNVVQTFRATLQVWAENGTAGKIALGTPREVLFVVPPIVN